jgi:hypothetical protein
LPALAVSVGRQVINAGPIKISFKIALEQKCRITPMDGERIELPRDTPGVYTVI